MHARGYAASAAAVAAVANAKNVLWHGFWPFWKLVLDATYTRSHTTHARMRLSRYVASAAAVAVVANGSPSTPGGTGFVNWF